MRSDSWCAMAGAVREHGEAIGSFATGTNLARSRFQAIWGMTCQRVLGTAFRSRRVSAVSHSVEGLGLVGGKCPTTTWKYVR